MSPDGPYGCAIPAEENHGFSRVATQVCDTSGHNRTAPGVCTSNAGGELSRAQQSQHQLAGDAPVPRSDPSFAVGSMEAKLVHQLSLAGFERAPTKAQLRRRPRSRVDHRSAEVVDDIVVTYLRRLTARGAAARGIDAYAYQLREILRAAARVSGRNLTLIGLFKDMNLLGQALVNDESRTGTQLSAWTLAQRRSAIRSFARLMRPELLPLLAQEPVSVIDKALREMAERVGGGYRLTGGRQRRRGGFVPDPNEVARVLDALRSTQGFVGLRDRAFFGLLAATGCRVNALRLLDGADIVVLSNGRMRLFLHEKGKYERRELELSAEDAAYLQDYLDCFNRSAAAGRWSSRLRIGEPGAIWRSRTGSRWGYASILAALRAGCAAAGVPEFTPHALRRAFATEAASQLPRHVVAQAGGWKGLQRLDDHYVQPREEVIWEKLGGHCDANSKPWVNMEKVDAATVLV